MTATVTKERVEEILSAASKCSIVVLGDVMLDEFVWGNVSRISPEAPVPVVDVQKESTHLGGAANVLANLLAIGAQACVVGVIGNDFAGERIQNSVHEQARLQTREMLITVADRLTTTKTRIIAHNQMVVRADREQRASVNGNVEKQIIEAAKYALRDANALVISDYDKGVITAGVLTEILPLAYARMPVLIDPKIRNFNAYRPATLVTPNHYEALRISNLEDDSEEGLLQAAQAIRAALVCDGVLVTRGDRGMILVEGEREPVVVQTVAREVYDVTGAGDTVIATLASALAAGASMTEAAVLANYAAGIVVGKLGTATVTNEEVLSSVP